MKVYDIVNENYKETELGRTRVERELSTIQRPEQDRKPKITLRHIHKLKIMKREQRQAHAEREKLINLMYGQSSEE